MYFVIGGEVDYLPDDRAENATREPLKRLLAVRIQPSP